MQLFPLPVQAIIFFLLTLGLELLPPHNINLATVYEWWMRIRKVYYANTTSLSEPLLESSAGGTAIEIDEDIDVQRERNRVLSGPTDSAIIYLRNLRKVLPLQTET